MVAYSGWRHVLLLSGFIIRLIVTIICMIKIEPLPLYKCEVSTKGDLGVGWHHQANQMNRLEI